MRGATIAFRRGDSIHKFQRLEKGGAALFMGFSEDEARDIVARTGRRIKAIKSYTGQLEVTLWN